MICTPKFRGSIQLDTRCYVVQRREGKVIYEAEFKNLKTWVGIDFWFAQCYSAAPAANGLNWLALSPDATITETMDSTTLSNEYTTNGLNRAQGTYAHTAGTSTCTITSPVWTVTGGIHLVNKSALFSATYPGGAINHIVLISPSTSLNSATNDTLVLTYTITLA